MAGTAPRPLPYLTSPAIAAARRHNRSAAVAGQLSHPQLAVVGIAFLAFVGLAVVTLAPQVSQQVHRFSAWTTPAAPSAPAPALDRTQLDAVASYAGTMRPDDTLVQVKPGVFAKRSNVEGVPVDGQTVYYDVLPHQSYGPLRSGKVTESQINLLAREQTGDALVVVYTLK